MAVAGARYRAAQHRHGAHRDLVEQYARLLHSSTWRSRTVTTSRPPSRSACRRATCAHVLQLAGTPILIEHNDGLQSGRTVDPRSRSASSVSVLGRRHRNGHHGRRGRTNFDRWWIGVSRRRRPQRRDGLRLPRRFARDLLDLGPIMTAIGTTTGSNTDGAAVDATGPLLRSTCGRFEAATDPDPGGTGGTTSPCSPAEWSASSASPAGARVSRCFRSWPYNHHHIGGQSSSRAESWISTPPIHPSPPARQAHQHDLPGPDDLAQSCHTSGASWAMQSSCIDEEVSGT